MSLGHIILIAVIAVIALLAIGGAIAGARRRRAREHDFGAAVDRVNRDLADARAEDRGWERELLEAAARRFFADAEPAAQVTSMELVQVVDEPGTDQDKAVFRVSTASGERHLTLGRERGEWVSEGVR
jgi:hypothetical protein